MLQAEGMTRHCDAFGFITEQFSTAWRESYFPRLDIGYRLA
jgi:hypothetical protein